jgi:hypothetical protein
MKTPLLFVFLLTAITLFAQRAEPPRAGFPCPIDIKSNQGGGDCKECVSSTPGQLPTNINGDFSQGTGVVTLNFGPGAQLNCIPRLLRVIDKDGFIREVLCGLGKLKQTGNDDVIVEYCLFGDNDFNFFNQPDVTAVLSYECAPNPIVIIGCNSEGEEIPLPVKFSSFNATRSTASSVSVTWTTASEQNSKGFYVQKNVAGVWTNVAYVPSQAQDGNSTSALNYSYTDMNSDKGITQYRIQQVDLDGKFAYTDIRAIRGEGAVGKVVLYPNPSSDGKVNVVFEDNTAIRDVIVNDMQGKVVRSFRGISNNILVIEKLTTGFYTIKVTNRTTNAASVHKVVIK